MTKSESEKTPTSKSPIDGATVTPITQLSDQKSASKKRGGARAGAGRPKGQVLNFVRTGHKPLPLFSCAVAAGFPSPADDHLEGSLDLNDHLIKHPSATFFVRVSGDSMIKAGIHHDDILVVDRSLEARNGKVIIAAVEGQLTVKRLQRGNGKTMLMPENDAYAPITVHDDNDMVIWGVVTNVIHPV